MSNDQTQEQIQQALAQAGITVTGGSVTFGGGIVMGDQIGHSGGTVHGDVVLGGKTEEN
ncbi:hypothetical protein KQY30_18150 [Streptomyces sp. GMY02]|uniref:hypothetical protein n=1 Tax=Streptomyces sp. GMY02 TaxID=1333528 RepID=UPI001C2BA5E3|nr:hypothetical protein [Streptomyces sp. GMY02]QXE35897.1 hypothetical protein KQY30_18150 [Streptomyces sp. GMY02]